MTDSDLANPEGIEDPYEAGRRFGCIARGAPLFESVPTDLSGVEERDESELRGHNRTFTDDVAGLLETSAKESDFWNCTHLARICSKYAYSCIGSYADLTLNCGYGGAQSRFSFRSRIRGAKACRAGRKLAGRPLSLTRSYRF
jgi:hypothetical protein